MNLNSLRFSFTIPIILSLIIITTYYVSSFLFFHVIAEAFAILVAFLIGIISYYTFIFTKNRYLLFLGLGYIWVGILDFFHVVSFPNMNLLDTNDVNVTLSIWVLTRVFEALILLTALLYRNKKFNPIFITILFMIISIFICFFSFNSPMILFIENSGLTLLKNSFEYFAIAILIVTFILNKRNYKFFNKKVYQGIQVAIVFTIIAELSFTTYAIWDGSPAVLGHVLKFISFWIIFQSLILTALVKPMNLLAKDSTTYNAIPICSILVTSDGIIKQVNDEACKSLNTDSENIINKSNHELFHSKDSAQSECKICKAIQDNKDLENFPVFDSSNNKHYLFSTRSIGGVDSYMGTVQVRNDITNEKILELEQKKHDEIITSVFQVLPDLLFIMKDDGTIIDYRVQKSSDLYLDSRLFLNKKMEDVLPLDIGKVFSENIKLLLKDNNLKVFKYELEIESEIKYYEARIAKLPIAGHIMTIIRDITENEKIKETSSKQEKMIYEQSKMAAMGEMIGNIAHQWRQPLSAISTGATGAKLQKEMNILSDKDFYNIMDSINNSAQYLSETIEDFRSFFDIKNNVKKEFLISDTIQKTLNIVTSQFATKEIEIIKNIEEISIVSIENELIQSLVNLLNNSRDALINQKIEHKLIFVNVYKEEDFIVIEIIDNAKGIDNKIIDRIFEPYFTTKHQSQGTGIGLYMTEEIITKHLNGTIEVINKDFDYDNISYNGAEFTIKISL